MRGRSIVFTSVCIGGGVYCRETGGRWDEEDEEREEEEERQGGKKGGGACVMAPGCRLECVCVRVLTQWKSICPLWNCGHREGKGVQTQPGHIASSKYSEG